MVEVVVGASWNCICMCGEAATILASLKNITLIVVLVQRSGLFANQYSVCTQLVQCNAVGRLLLTWLVMRIGCGGNLPP